MLLLGREIDALQKLGLADKTRYMVVLQHNLNWLYRIHISDAELSGDLKTIFNKWRSYVPELILWALM